MKHFFSRALILLAVFIAAVCIFFLATGRTGDQEISYTVMGSSSLPVVTMKAAGKEVNSLTAYTGEMDLGEVEDSLTPLPEDRKLPIAISTHGNTLTGISYEVRSADGSNLIERAELDNWEIAGTHIDAVITLKDLIDRDVEYSLMIVLTTERITSVRYYTRILWSDELKTQEMLDYVTAFHQATYNSEDAQQFAINWEVDGTGDNESLATVDIHSNFRQLTFRGLDPMEIGSPQITILEMDPRFGSFRIRYGVTALDENNDAADYYLEEFFCLQWSSVRFYLMSYERKMTQIFTASSSAVTADRLSFGIANADDISVVTSPDGALTAFTQCGELWMYEPAEGQLTQVFSFRSGEEQDVRLHTDYELKIIDLDDEGNLSFFLYGHMNRGEHEGENGLSYFRYERSSGTIKELMYIPSMHSCGRIAADLATLAVKHNNIIYFLLNDTVFAMDSEGLEIIRMIDGADAHRAVVNAAQDTIAWQLGEDLELAGQIQVLSLDTGSSYSLSADAGEYLRAGGFVERDFVAGIGRTDEIRTVGFTRIYPLYAVTITDIEGQEAARYSYNDIVITDMHIDVGQVGLERARVSSGYRRIEDDVLMQNDIVIEKEESVLSSEITEKRLRIRYLKLTGKNRSSYDLELPRQISWYLRTSPAPGETERTVRYYSYVKGELTGIYGQAGQAIGRAYDGMGYVTDTDGRRIWHRTARFPVSRTVTLAAGVQAAEETGRMAGCLDAILRTEGLDTDASALLAEGQSPAEILESQFGCAVDLTGCELKQIYLFLGRGLPVIALDGEDRPWLLTGYDLSGVWVYDSVEGSSSRITFDDAAARFDVEGGRYLTYMKE